MAKENEFIATREQVMIEGDFNGEILMGLSDEPYRLAVQAPAGTGKTATTLYVMSELQKIDPLKKVGYFVFNKFMQKEISIKAYYGEIHNAEFFTYHSFLLQHALKNEKLKKFFYDKDDNLLIDFQKNKYSKNELDKASMQVLNTDYHIFSELIEYGMSKWLTTETSIVPLMRDIAKKILDPKNKDEVDDKIYHIKQFSHNIKEILEINQKKMLSRLKKEITNKISSEELLALFLVQGVKKLSRNEKFTKNGYYKEVYSLALKHNIDIFEGLDAIMVDEWQDADPVFKNLIDRAKVPVMVIGDQDQSIYLWRGALNMMEWANKNYTTLSIPYSFRFANDIAYLSQLLVREKETPSESNIYGRFTPTPSTITNEIINYDEMSLIVKRSISESLKRINREKGGVDDLNKKQIAKEMSRRKTAFIARNNATLIDAIFHIVPKLKEDTEKTMKKEAIYKTFSDALPSSTTPHEIEDFAKGILPDSMRILVEMYKGIDYASYKKGKTLRDIFTDEDVLTALSTEKDYKVLSRKTFIKRLENNVGKVSSGTQLQIALSSSVSEDFKNIRQAKFPKWIEKKMSEELGMPFAEFKFKKSLEDILKSEKVRDVLMETKFSFLVDPEKFKHFSYISAELSSRKADSIKSDDKTANIIFSTIHGTKGKDYNEVIVFNDIMKPDQEEHISDEEYNLAYVAISRVREKLYFGATSDDATHHLHNFTQNNMGEIERYLSQEYKYDFPHGVTMSISKMGSLYSHNFMDGDEFMGACVIDKPISMGAVIYNIEDKPLGIRYFGGGKGYEFLNFSGDELTPSKTERESYRYHYGTGKTIDKKESVKKKLTHSTDKLDVDTKQKSRKPQ